MLMTILLILRTKQPYVEVYLCTRLALGERVIDYKWKAPSWGDLWSKAKQAVRDSHCADEMECCVRVTGRCAHQVGILRKTIQVTSV